MHVGGHGAIKYRAVALRVGMVVDLLGESGKLLLVRATLPTTLPVS